MKIKSLFLASSLIAIAAAFSYCTKEQDTTLANETAAPTEVAERGICNVAVTAFNCTVDICGTQNTPNVCFPALGNNLIGNDMVAANATGNYVLTTPTMMRVFINPNFPVGANPFISVAAGGVIKVYPLLPAGGAAAVGPVIVKINNACVPF